MPKASLLKLRRKYYKVILHPIVLRNVPRMDERRNWAQYLVNTLLQVPAFRAKEVNQAKSISHRTYRMAATAILGPLSVLKDSKKVDKHIEFNPDIVHSWVLDVAQGRNTDIDAINGWLVNRGELIGEPCPTHKAAIELVKKKTEENRIKEEAKGAALEAKQDFRSISPEREPKGEPSEDEIYGPEKLEKRRMEKLACQRENFGKLPLPESYVKPEIRPFGGARRVRG
ncbi:uncharacterized protein PAC_14582 [Phialocephala subalpina]|uniref:Ketopantoate reductase C-terminal domain-containing protein n=1 Tax=Phialocephala subalpina TaxID=576137 RepID=A0A1L7XI32_9HELO|nr:uncharacterized protein PAC_14582 [Phialocephala subalpina]